MVVLKRKQDFMGKDKKNAAIEQVMNELNEEAQSFLDSSPDLFVSGLVDERHLPEEKEQTKGDGSLIHFKPHKDLAREQNRKLKNEEKKDLNKKISDISSAEKKSNFKRDMNSDKIEDSSKGRISLGQKKKHYKRVNLGIKSTSKVKKEENNEKLRFSQNMNPSSENNIPMQITLQQSENLRVAQEHIVALEMEIERLRTENEELIATGDIFRERLDKVIIQNDNLKKIYEESRQEFQDEKRTLMNTLSSQTREIEKINIKNKELEKRLSSNIQQIRVRERELENRLELMKLDNQTLAREKDQYILDLKRQIDKLKMDLDSQKNKYNEKLQQLEGYQNQNRRVTRGLQMILHIARGSDVSQEQQQEIKKTE